MLCARAPGVQATFGWSLGVWARGGRGGVNRVSSGRRKGDSFDRASRSLLLFTLSGRREGDSFNRASRSIARHSAPPVAALVRVIRAARRRIV